MPSFSIKMSKLTKNWSYPSGNFIANDSRFNINEKNMEIKFSVGIWNSEKNMHNKKIYISKKIYKNFQFKEQSNGNFTNKELQPRMKKNRNNISKLLISLILF